MPLSGMLTCGNCGTRTQMNAMRYNLAGSKLICQNCVDKERSGIKPGTTQPSALRLQKEQMMAKSKGQEAALRATADSGTVNYYCRACRFKFSRKKDVEISSCPYCGRQSVNVAYEGKAQDLIEDVGKGEEELF
ncbi:hypothetical protein HYU17_03235 [Candidatus Woesearchaeota archaeon]|nr:hypothetical protein [Candidatus Woesearchaeota archaeon]